jgi:hypothetical protein
MDGDGERENARDICDVAAIWVAPNAAQQILCQMFALKVLRVQLLVKEILSCEIRRLIWRARDADVERTSNICYQICYRTR